MLKFIKNYKFNEVRVYRKNKTNDEYKLVGAVSMKNLKDRLNCFDIDVINLNNLE